MTTKSPMQLTDENTSKFAQVNGIRMHYNEAGTGEGAVVMLHGGGPGASGWSNFSTNIGPFAEHYRTILWDAPNYGKTDALTIKDEVRTHHAARHMKGLLDAIGVKKAHFLGNSFGGATTIDFALHYPEMVGKIVLVGPAGYGPSTWLPTPLDGIKALNHWWHEPTRENMAKIVELFMYDKKFKTDELIDARMRWATANPKQIKARLASTGPQKEYTFDLHKIANPTLVVWGRDDRFSPLDWGMRLIWHMPNARLHVYPECGHWVQYEKSDQFNRLVLSFLQEK